MLLSLGFAGVSVTGAAIGVGSEEHLDGLGCRSRSEPAGRGAVTKLRTQGVRRPAQTWGSYDISCREAAWQARCSSQASPWGLQAFTGGGAHLARDGPRLFLRGIGMAG